MVLYQAKVNSDEYNFIKKHYPTSQDILNARANGGITLPKGNATQTGAVEIKTAWRLLVDGDKPADFFTRKAIYYRKSNDSIFYHNGTFALIGIHIIHKTEKAPDFVFATWEHVGVEKDDMAYVLLKNGKEEGGLHKNYKRFSPIPDLVRRANKSVHKQIKDKNENSIWKNYRLVGVQGKPTNDSSSMSYFLANYVIESDKTLANFHGSSISTPFDGMPNTTLNGQRYNMGGCMGCHGVAQSKGVDFSFLLDSIGKPIKEPDLLNHIPSDAEKGKLERYMESF